VMLLAAGILIPILGGFLAYIIGRSSPRAAGVFSFMLLAVSSLLFLMANYLYASTVPAAAGPPIKAPEIQVYREQYDWRPIGRFGFLIDGVSFPFALTILILTTLITLYSIPYMVHRIREEGVEDVGPRMGLYYLLYLLYSAGMVGSVLATNLVEFYLFYELMLIPSYLLIAEFGYGDRNRIALMYFLWTHVGALVLLAGLLTLGLSAGSFDIPALNTAAVPEFIKSWVLLAFLIGFGTKLAAFGLHVWLPFAHAEAPTPISALLSPAMIGIGGYGLIRFAVQLLGGSVAYTTSLYAISAWGAATMVYGAVMALAQSDIKRLLAYSSISQMGYIIFGVASGQFVGVSGSIFQYVSHGLGKGILFMMAGVLILQAHGLRDIGRMGGLAGRLPITATLSFIGFLTIFGLPFLAGFHAEWMIFLGAFTSPLYRGDWARLYVAAVALGATALTAAYTLWTAKRVFFGELPRHLEGVREAPALAWAPMAVLAALSVLLGAYPGLIAAPALERLKTLLGGIVFG
jgi:NADH-quinone oxidoreductase subunit M